VTSAGCYDLQIYDALEALPRDFHALFEKAGQQSVFHTWTWYANFVESVLRPGDRLRIYALRSASGGPRAALVTQHAAPRPFSVRKLVSLSNYYSSLFGPVVDPDDPELESLLTVLAQAIARDRCRWDEIYLNPLAAEARAPGRSVLFVRQLVRHGRSAELRAIRPGSSPNRRPPAKEAAAEPSVPLFARHASGGRRARNGRLRTRLSKQLEDGRTLPGLHAGVGTALRRAGLAETGHRLP
jgi:hypothetical protein